MAVELDDFKLENAYRYAVAGPGDHGDEDLEEEQMADFR